MPNPCIRAIAVNSETHAIAVGTANSEVILITSSGEYVVLTQGHGDGEVWGACTFAASPPPTAPRPDSDCTPCPFGGRSAPPRAAVLAPPPTALLIAVWCFRGVHGPTPTPTTSRHRAFDQRNGRHVLHRERRQDGPGLERQRAHHAALQEAPETGAVLRVVQRLRHHRGICAADFWPCTTPPAPPDMLCLVPMRVCC